MKIKEILIILLMCLILLVGCYDKPQQEKEIWTLEKEKVVIFPDGEFVNLWKTNRTEQDIYKLSDGTSLLRVNEQSGPANVYVGGIESFDNLSENAQNTVSTFYEEQGLLYNLQSELEKAYSEYLNCKSNGNTFNDLFISQDISPTASNDSIMCFLTSVTLPISGQMYQEIRLGAVFDRQTGEVQNTWDLFSLPENEIRKKLLKLSQITDIELLIEMENALKPEYIILFPDTLEITFPRGTLPSQEYSCILGIDYDDLDGVIQTWAIPDSHER